jgi:hypothetical protein
MTLSRVTGAHDQLVELVSLLDDRAAGWPGIPSITARHGGPPTIAFNTNVGLGAGSATVPLETLTPSLAGS